MQIVQGQQFQFAFFDLVLTKRGRSTWVWRVNTQSGRLVMQGTEATRTAARYGGQRGLFLLLTTSWLRGNYPNSEAN
jgi:hypothetical protein